MSDTVIRVENIAKRYQLGSIGTGTLSQDLNRWWARVRGRQDPTLKINETQREGEHWALKDVSFEIKQGDAVGIVGKNGAGKSTLLKILSRVTTPTSGRIRAKGRIASLLEVGTGFHPDLTGRENVFMNGAILGMRKVEIKSKFDEIVDFSGVEKYIDTPVKRYSSGMYVRLAFAVAAHLEPEILIVDEVLAVGDADFQKKCLGKMENVAGQGRTVLFVSHNMNSVNRLCNKGILLKSGLVEAMGSTSEIINKYLEVYSSRLINQVKFPLDQNKDVQLVEAQIVDEKGELLNSSLEVTTRFFLKITHEVRVNIKKLKVGFQVHNSHGDVVLFSDIADATNQYTGAEPGLLPLIVEIPNPLFVPGNYSISIACVNMDTGFKDARLNCLFFELQDLTNVRSSRPGYIFKPLNWVQMEEKFFS